MPVTRKANRIEHKKKIELQSKTFMCEWEKTANKKINRKSFGFNIRRFCISNHGYIFFSCCQLLRIELFLSFHSIGFDNSKVLLHNVCSFMKTIENYLGFAFTICNTKKRRKIERKKWAWTNLSFHQMGFWNLFCMVNI